VVTSLKDVCASVWGEAKVEKKLCRLFIGFYVCPSAPASPNSEFKDLAKILYSSPFAKKVRSYVLPQTNWERQLLVQSALVTLLVHATVNPE
jgi:hypothetical protein